MGFQCDAYCSSKLHHAHRVRHTCCDLYFTQHGERRRSVTTRPTGHRMRRCAATCVFRVLNRTVFRALSLCQFADTCQSGTPDRICSCCHCRRRAHSLLLPQRRAAVSVDVQHTHMMTMQCLAVCVRSSRTPGACVNAVNRASFARACAFRARERRGSAPHTVEHNMTCYLQRWRSIAASARTSSWLERHVHVAWCSLQPICTNGASSTDGQCCNSGRSPLSGLQQA